jgi:hypothetical protein
VMTRVRPASATMRSASSRFSSSCRPRCCRPCRGPRRGRIARRAQSRTCRNSVAAGRRRRPAPSLQPLTRTSDRAFDRRGRRSCRGPRRRSRRTST